MRKFVRCVFIEMARTAELQGRPVIRHIWNRGYEIIGPSLELASVDAKAPLGCWHTAMYRGSFRASALGERRGGLSVTIFPGL